MRTREMPSKSRSKISLMLLVMLTSLFLLNLTFLNSNLQKTQNNSTQLISSQTTVDSLIINGNDAFEQTRLDKSWCSGLGTAASPYVIQDVTFDAEGKGYCLIIKNVDKVFKIKECTFTSSGETEAAVLIENCNNGLGATTRNTIEDCRFEDSGYGLMVKNSDYMLITKNTFYENIVGLFLDASDSCLVYQNYFIYSQAKSFVEDSSYNNLFYDPSLPRGNYYSDCSTTKDPLNNFTVTLGEDRETILLSLGLTSYITGNSTDSYPIYSPDTDGDKLTDVIEILGLETNYENSDTDGDKIDDYYESQNEMNCLKNDASSDNDGDGLTNLYEYQTAYTHSSDGFDYYTNPNDADSDNDGFSDGDEVKKNTDPTNPNDHEDIKPEYALTIPFGNYYLIFLAFGIGALFLLVRKRVHQN